MKVLASTLVFILSTALVPAAETSQLVERFEKEKFELLHRLNQRYLEEFEAQRHRAMQEGDLPGANVADRLVKEFLGEKQKLEEDRNRALFIASLAGDWRLTSSGWSFKIFADGTATASEPSEERGRIEVIDYEKRSVRMTGFARSMTWVVSEGAQRLEGTQHPARRIDLDLELEELLKQASDAVASGPQNASELADFLDGTMWNISNATEDGQVVYTMTFHKDGTFRQSDGRVGKLEFLGARTFKLWNYDPARLDDNLKQFRAVGAATVYFGNLRGRE